MELSIGSQLFALSATLVLGAALGLGYDLLRAFRLRFKAKLVTALMDGLFCLICAYSVFRLCVEYMGEIRPYVLVTVPIGAVMWFVSLSRLFRPAAEWILEILSRLFRVAAAPFVYTAIFLTKAGIFLKNRFISYVNRYIIQQNYLRSSREHLKHASPKRGANAREEEKEKAQRRDVYLGRDTDSGDLRGHYTYSAPGTDS